MKQLLLLLLLFFTDIGALSRLNSSNNFGKTHFIRGYSGHPRYKPVRKEAPQPIRLTRSLFSHKKDDILAEISKTLIQAQQKIDVAAFSLTDSRIAKQLIEAHKRGVDVCVIMDAGNMNNRYSKAKELIKNGVMVLRYDPTLRTDHKQKNYESIMHLKWIIADDVLVTGSANFTQSAQNGYSIESITISTCPYEVADHRQALQDLKKLCVQCR